MKLAVITWLWGNRFAPEDVKKLYSGFNRNYDLPFQFYCINDLHCGFGSNIKSVPMPPKFCEMYYHRCYRRLSLFDWNYGHFFGDKILQLDIDVAVVGNVTELFNIQDDFKIWECRSRGKYHGKSALVKNPTVMLFNPEYTKTFYDAFVTKSAGMIMKAKHKYHGSDQGLISYYFKDCPVWTESDGIYAYRDSEAVKKMVIPENAKIISFHGPSNCKSKMDVYNKLRG